MIGRILASLVVHAGSAAAAFIATGAVHTFSDRVIWALFPWAHQVRQFSIYLVDVAPFFVAIFALISTVCQVFFRLGPYRLVTLVALAMVSVPVTVLAHQSFFPTSDRAIAVLTVFAVYYASAFLVLQGIVYILTRSKRPFVLLPAVSGFFSGLSTALLLSAFYVGGFYLAQKSGYLDDETETYRPAQGPSAPEDRFTQATAFGDETVPRPGLFVAEDIALIGLGALARGSADVVDVNGDGLFDLVARDNRDVLTVWINERGILKKADTFVGDLANQTVGTFSFADYDRDGLMDLFVAQPVKPAQSTFETIILKKLFWYFSRKPAMKGRLFRQTEIGKWYDVTASAFPEGVPGQFRKTEPILWFDFNGDGRLDIVWSGYTHPHGGGQNLYVQNPDGSFSDKIDEILSWSPGRIYAEGSDVADIDGDGDIDVFAYGYMFRNDDGRFVQICGDEMPGVYCDAEARNDEGGLFEDIDGDGILDFVLSYHGVGGAIPKYYLQLFRGQGPRPWKLVRDKAHESRFYGFNTYLRAKDFDLNGKPDVLTNDPGRLLTFHDGKWVDLLPDLAAGQNGDLWPLGWLDIEEDGDWDFLALRVGDDKAILFRNTLDPDHYMKISVAGADGVENQYGATVRIGLPGGRQAVASYRPMGGYQGVTDPRLVYPLQPGHEYRIEVCFPSLEGPPSAYARQANVRIEVLEVFGRCVTYRMAVAEGVTRLDLTLLAGQGTKVFPSLNF